MAYEWPAQEIDPVTGVPFCKLVAARLEKDGVKKKFVGQDKVDWAWADGWHEPGKPETADGPENPEEIYKPWGDRWPDKEEIMGMNLTQLKGLVREKGLPGVDNRMGLDRYRRYMIDFVDSITVSGE